MLSLVVDTKSSNPDHNVGVLFEPRILKVERNYEMIPHVISAYTYGMRATSHVHAHLHTPPHGYTHTHTHPPPPPPHTLYAKSASN